VDQNDSGTQHNKEKMEDPWTREQTAHENWLELMSQMMFLECWSCHLDTARYHLVESMVWAQRYHGGAFQLQRQLDVMRTMEESLGSFIQWIEQEKARLRRELWNRRPLPRTPFQL